MDQQSRRETPLTEEGGGRVTTGHTLFLLALLVVPTIAIVRSRADWKWTAGYLALVNVLTYWLYGRDKRKALQGDWRVPELKLHLLELIGGWPAAFLAQRHFRHKCSKVSYQLVFWCIVILFQFASWDSIRDWHVCKNLAQRVAAIEGARK